MALELARALAATERDDDFHIARLLLLMEAISGKRAKMMPVQGITKLAKLDFLLRYPNCLERALAASSYSPIEAKVHRFERTTIESKMIRFRFGPWDHRYRRWVALMAAQGLVTVDIQRRTVQLWLTATGKETAATIAGRKEHEVLVERARVISRRFGSQSGSALMKFVYATFPELTNMRWGEEIEL
jgi:hypothetical protein